MNSEIIIILHGLGRSPKSMRKLDRKLSIEGYTTFNVDYPSHFKNYQEILSQLTASIKNYLDRSPLKNQHVHFIGHSFGGILIRGLLSNLQSWQPENRNISLGRCVMLGTPNQGTSMANFMVKHPILKYLTPKVSAELMLNSKLIHQLPVPSIETGIIAGNKTFTPFIPVTWFYGKASGNAPGDGIVEISSTQCSNMSDFIIMPLHHSFMMWDSQLIEQCSYFIKTGHFKR